MENERENFSDLSLGLDNSGGAVVPVISFGTTERELKPENFEIQNNVIVAYYDAAHKLIFVLDKTKGDERKPNVLLVISRDDDRKWDDILKNDYDIDLETVRPKENNKYQKLDIEYGGLSVYNKLINDYNSGADLGGALAELEDFRNLAAEKSARARLEAARETAAAAKITIEKANETLAELEVRRKELREKLSAQRKKLGKEPPKESAAKILRTETALDRVLEKQKRARRRLAKAEKRLESAETDATVAQNILGLLASNKNIAETDIIIAETEPDVEEIMAEEIKPMLDKDPEILDESIAFKPIEFDSIYTAPTPQPERVEFTETAPAAPPPAPEPQPVYQPEPSPVVAEPVVPAVPVVPQPVPQPAPIVRPTSPITGNEIPIGSASVSRKPGAMYYVMLVLLIALSVFTLWLYQKSNNGTVPELSAPLPVVPTEVAEPTPAVAPTPAPEPAPVQIAEPEPVFAPAPVVEDFESEEVEQFEPSFIATPVSSYIEPQEVPEPVAFEPAPVVNKPAYDVSGGAQFRTNDYYEPEYIEPTQPEQFIESAPAPLEPEYYENEYYEDTGATVQEPYYENTTETNEQWLDDGGYAHETTTTTGERYSSEYYE